MVFHDPVNIDGMKNFPLHGCTPIEDFTISFLWPSLSALLPLLEFLYWGLTHCYPSCGSSSLYLHLNGKRCCQCPITYISYQKPEVLGGMHFLIPVNMGVSNWQREYLLDVVSLGDGAACTRELLELTDFDMHFMHDIGNATPVLSGLYMSVYCAYAA